MTDPPPLTEAQLVEFVRSADVRAPDALHREVESLIDERSARARRRSSSARRSRAKGPLGRGLAVAGVLGAAVIVALVVGLRGGGAPVPSPHQAFALTLRPATVAAPPESPSSPAELVAAVEGVAFPYWGERFGWRSTGARSDRIAGRSVTTVFYENRRGSRIGYAIVSGEGSSGPSGGVVVRRGGTPYHLLSENGVPVLVWLRNGHLCVVSGRGVDGATLLRLASSDGQGSQPS